MMTSILGMEMMLGGRKVRRGIRNVTDVIHGVGWVVKEFAIEREKLKERNKPSVYEEDNGVGAIFFTEEEEEIDPSKIYKKDTKREPELYSFKGDPNKNRKDTSKEETKFTKETVSNEPTDTLEETINQLTSEILEESNEKLDSIIESLSDQEIKISPYRYTYDLIIGDINDQGKMIPLLDKPVKLNKNVRFSHIITLREFLAKEFDVKSSKNWIETLLNEKKFIINEDTEDPVVIELLTDNATVRVISYDTVIGNWSIKGYRYLNISESYECIHKGYNGY